MQIKTALVRNVDVVVDDVTFQIRAPDGYDKLAALRVMSEVASSGIANVATLSAEARRAMVEVINAQVVGWSGVTDEYGRTMAFDQGACGRFLSPETLLVLFFRIVAATRPTQDEEKNLSTASKSARSAPDTSIADNAANSASTPAENPAT